MWANADKVGLKSVTLRYLLCIRKQYDMYGMVELLLMGHVALKNEHRMNISLVVTFATNLSSKSCRTTVTALGSYIRLSICYMKLWRLHA